MIAMKNIVKIIGTFLSIIIFGLIGGLNYSMIV